MADPANPSGLCLEAERLMGLVAAARKHKVRLVLDEALDAQSLEPRLDLAPLAAAQPGLFVVRSLSKGLGLPGLRLGYVVAHPREIGRLLPFTRPWSVSSLAQAVGAWALAQERRLAAAVAREWRGRKARSWWPAWRKSGLQPESSGHRVPACWLCPRRGLMQPPWLQRLESKGILVRSCHTYGPWGRRVLRLNPRTPRENARLGRRAGATLGLKAR